MGGGESKVVTDYVISIDRKNVTEINNRLKETNIIYKKYDAFNSVIDLCIELQMLSNICEKYCLDQVLKDTRSCWLNIKKEDIIRMTFL